MTSHSHNFKNKNKINNIKRKIHQSFIKKYENLYLKYNVNIIDNIIYNERAHIVAEFKDRLIIDDQGEFLKRYYKYYESLIRLPKFYEYYILYSKIFPNYTSLPEGKYFYRNIQKKQRMIDLQEQFEIEKQDKLNDESISNNIINDDRDKNNKDEVFSTDVINSILNQSDSQQIEILFNVKRNNISKDEESFNDKLNEIIKQLNDFDIKKNINKKHKKKSTSNSNNKSKDRKNNNNKSKNGNKNKHKSKINNTVLGNNINDDKYVKLNYFNKSTFRKNTIFNLKNGKKMNNSINLINNSGLNKLSQNGKNFIKIIEHNIFKRKQLMSKSLNKNAFHNISCSTSIKKELSKSKMNSSNNSKKNILTGSSSPFNILNNINFSFNKKIKNHHKKYPNYITNNKNIEIIKKNSNKLPININSDRSWKKSHNFSLDKKKMFKNKIIQTKNTYSTHNIHNYNNHKKSSSNGNLTKRKKHNVLNNFTKIDINNFNISKKIHNFNNINNNVKKVNRRRIIKNNNYIVLSKRSKLSNNTYNLIDSRNCCLNEILNSYRYHKTNSTKKNSANSHSISIHNISKSRSKSNKKNNNSSKKNIKDSNNSNLYKPKTTKSKIENNFKNSKKNIINKYRWKNDSRNKRPLFMTKNTSKFKTKNILNQNDSSTKISFLDVINYIKKSNKDNKDIRHYSKIFKCMSNKNLSSHTQRNYSINI